MPCPPTYFDEGRTSQSKIPFRVIPFCTALALDIKMLQGHATLKLTRPLFVNTAFVVVTPKWKKERTFHATMAHKKRKTNIEFSFNFLEQIHHVNPTLTRKYKLKWVPAIVSRSSINRPKRTWLWKLMYFSLSLVSVPRGMRAHRKLSTILRTGSSSWLLGNSMFTISGSLSPLQREKIPLTSAQLPGFE